MIMILCPINMSSNEDSAEILDVKEKTNSIESDLSIGILKLLKPAVEQVDRRVLDVRYSHFLS